MCAGILIELLKSTVYIVNISSVVELLPLANRRRVAVESRERMRATEAATAAVLRGREKNVVDHYLKQREERLRDARLHARLLFWGALVCPPAPPLVCVCVCVRVACVCVCACWAVVWSFLYSAHDYLLDFTLVEAK